MDDGQKEESLGLRGDSEMDLGKIARVVLALAVWAFLPGLAAAQSPPSAAPAVLAAGKLDGSLRVDGLLDEPAWNSASVVELAQQDPNPGQITPYDTRLQALHDGKNLYFGFTCIDPEPARIAVHTMQRDGNMNGDDSVAVVLGTFGEGRNGYLFRVGAGGALQDGLFTSGERLSLDWDGVWQARVRMIPGGWSAEIAIPTTTLRFDPRLDQWELNAERSLPRNRLKLRWTGLTLDSSLTDLQRSGRLGGIDGLNQGSGLSVSPYGLFRAKRVLGGGPASEQVDGGLDLSWSPTPEISMVATLNTDFAETEVDTRQVNLSRFPLFFPEKRTFFVEGSDRFEFAIGLSSQFIPFFSRRVGLYEDQEVSVLGGLKVVGQAGRWNLAVLDTMMDDSDLTASTNLFAGRLTFDASQHLRLGAIVTDGDPAGVGSSSLAGFDAVWQTATLFGDKNFMAGIWAAGSRGDRTATGNNSGWGFKIDYPNDLWDVYFSFNEYGNALDASLGYLPRSGVRISTGGADFCPRPQKGFWAWARQFFFEIRGQVVENTDGWVESRFLFFAPLNVVTQAGDRFELNWRPQFEHLDAPFEIVEGVVIPPGGYHFNRYRVEAESSTHRIWRAGSTLWFGEFYSGRLINWEAYAGLGASSGRWQVDIEAENNFADLPEGDFVQRLWQLKTVWAFSPDLVLSLYGQYDSETRNLGLNTRLRWTIGPGNDLFFVWNHDWERSLASDDRWALRPLTDQVVLKLRLTFRW